MKFFAAAALYATLVAAGPTPVRRDESTAGSPSSGNPHPDIPLHKTIPVHEYKFMIVQSQPRDQPPDQQLGRRESHEAKDGIKAGYQNCKLSVNDDNMVGCYPQNADGSNFKSYLPETSEEITFSVGADGNLVALKSKPEAGQSPPIINPTMRFPTDPIRARAEGEEQAPDPKAGPKRRPAVSIVPRAGGVELLQRKDLVVGPSDGMTEPAQFKLEEMQETQEDGNVWSRLAVANAREGDHWQVVDSGNGEYAVEWVTGKEGVQAPINFPVDVLAMDVSSLEK